MFTCVCVCVYTKCANRGCETRHDREGEWERRKSNNKKNRREKNYSMKSKINEAFGKRRHPRQYERFRARGSYIRICFRIFKRAAVNKFQIRARSYYTTPTSLLLPSAPPPSSAKQPELITCAQCVPFVGSTPPPPRPRPRYRPSVYTCRGSHKTLVDETGIRCRNAPLRSVDQSGGCFFFLLKTTHARMFPFLFVTFRIGRPTVLKSYIYIYTTEWNSTHSSSH